MENYEILNSRIGASRSATCRHLVEEGVGLGIVGPGFPRGPATLPKRLKEHALQFPVGSGGSPF